VAIVAGVDEAGFGPLLGPLTIGYSAFRVVPGREDLWKALSRTVSRDKTKDKNRIVVHDSKEVFARNPRGRQRLETTALTFLALLRPDRTPPPDARWMLDGALRPDAAWLERHPWYALLAPRLPLFGDAGAIELRAERLWRAMGRASVEPVDAGVRVVPAGELNASFAATGSKSTTLWDKTAEVLVHLWSAFGAEGLRVVADAQGARTNYGPPLSLTFPRALVRLLHEGPGFREYELVESASDDSPARRMRLCFAPRADQSAFTTALASCLAKYARETVMEAFNAYFAALQPDLAPTAGYRSDGWRWLDDARPALRAAALDGLLVRRER